MSSRVVIDFSNFSVSVISAVHAHPVADYIFDRVFLTKRSEEYSVMLVWDCVFLRDVVFYVITFSPDCARFQNGSGLNSFPIYVIQLAVARFKCYYDAPSRYVQEIYRFKLT